MAEKIDVGVGRDRRRRLRRALVVMISASVGASLHEKRWQNDVTLSLRMRFKKPCVLFAFAGVHIHPRETPVAIEPRLMMIAAERIKK